MLLPGSSRADMAVCRAVAAVTGIGRAATASRPGKGDDRWGMPMTSTGTRRVTCLAQAGAVAREQGATYA
jgi:hypothetical protein